MSNQVASRTLDQVSGYLIMPADQPADADTDGYLLFNDYEEAVRAAQDSDEQGWEVVWFEATTTVEELVARVPNEQAKT